MRNLFVVAFAASLASACAPPSTTTGGPTGRFTCSVDSDCGFDQVCGASDSCRDLQPGECRQDNPNICGCEFDMECPGDMTCGAAGLCEGSGGGGGGGGQNDAGPVNPPSENCESAADCPMDMYCNPTSLECAELPAGTCRENAQCESNNCVIREGRELG